MKLSYKVTGLVVALLVVSSAQAHPDRRPPAEAFNACESSSEGQSCSFSVPEREIEGMCITPPRRSALVCAPEGRRHGKGKGDKVDDASSREQTPAQNSGS
jgi:hypothetical protein